MKPATSRPMRTSPSDSLRQTVEIACNARTTPRRETVRDLIMRCLLVGSQKLNQCWSTNGFLDKAETGRGMRNLRQIQGSIDKKKLAESRFVQCRYVKSNIACTEPHKTNAVRDLGKFAVLLRVRSRGTGHRQNLTLAPEHSSVAYFLSCGATI